MLSFFLVKVLFDVGKLQKQNLGSSQQLPAAYDMKKLGYGSEQHKHRMKQPVVISWHG